MVKILAGLDPITKDSTNTHFNYKYRGIDAAMAALNPLLVEHEVFLLPHYHNHTITPADRGGVRAQLMLELEFVATDGSKCSCIVPGEAIDKGDKATMKAIANSMKYAIYNTFCIPTEEKKDSEAFSDVDRDASVPAVVSGGAVPEEGDRSEEHATLDAEVHSMLNKIKRVRSASGLDRMKTEARKLARKLDSENPLRQRLIDAVQAKTAALADD
jgi:hypothetical protein